MRNPNDCKTRQQYKKIVQSAVKKKSCKITQFSIYTSSSLKTNKTLWHDQTELDFTNPNQRHMLISIVVMSSKGAFEEHRWQILGENISGNVVFNIKCC